MNRLLFPLLAVPLALACDSKGKTQLRTVSLSDSVRADSIIQLKNEMLDEVMRSTQFLSDINSEVAKLKLRPTKALASSTQPESELTRMREERSAVRERIRELVARLDSSEARLASLRQRAASLSARDAQLTEQVAQYERTIADLRASLESQRAEFQAVVERQNQQIAALNLTIDTVTRANIQLAGERAALSTERAALVDTLGRLVEEQNTVYYVIGTRDQLLRDGILVEEGRKRLLLVGSRTVATNRALDPAKFTRIDRMRDRDIVLPPGEYRILTRQNPDFATASTVKDGRLMGTIHIDDPARFWDASRFLILVRNQ